jgi:thioredoxin-like negative regulator of GroEL
MEIYSTYTTEEWESLVKREDAVLLYLYNTSCDICNSLRPKVKSLIESKFPKIKMVTLNAVENQELAAQIRMLSVPGIILYMDGKETHRANGLIILSEFESRIRRPYEMMFS